MLLGIKVLKLSQLMTDQFLYNIGISQISPRDKSDVIFFFSFSFLFLSFLLIEFSLCCNSDNEVQSEENDGDEDKEAGSG